ncbi:amino acid ABC transporter substrate-binding protein, PAAT family (TC 3.A.1.3.-) [Halogranum amylolyticum]|uniref:Amino acid ABC transporter substrate-binding protein, PAAT family (TC 3.A.1.3.-) n=1 Tax=Halogranum amylolyticum TaxID=660520 RepID=A0A1H8RJX8_9EURY|nr:basic amino acid ABC transporter substrate-binding protein [Halogranum amylolyticum]SEO66656.1 amino acid ABC transporter substrate-binding protein, PAAT family (TC 3.A.1.3.-) [Halogranum amylolyticum]
MDRRSYLKSTSAAMAALALAGCTSGGDGGDGGSNGTTGSDGGATGNGTGSGGDGSSLPDKVVIGSDIPYRPFEYETAAGELKGFDVEIARAVFDEQLGVTSEFKKTSFDTIIASLNQGNFRVIMSAMTINDERAQQVDFSEPYFTAYQTIVVRQDSDIDSKEALKGTTVGVQKGTTGLDAAQGLQEEFGGDLELKEYDQITGAFDALSNGQVQAVINDNTVNAEFVNNQDGFRFVEGEGAAAEEGENAPPYLTLTVENYGIAFRQDDDEFREQVNEALAAVRESGTYDDIYSNYFSG